jgi:hypothetical protein
MNFEVEKISVDSKPRIWIEVAEYKKLLQAQKELDCLHAGGVDNWEWYHESLQDGGFFDDE